MDLNKRWRIHHTYPNYFISEDGEVFSLTRNRIMNYKIDRYGYRVYSVMNYMGERKTKPVHRLVAECFLEPNNYGKKQINHIDGNKLNNHVSNLEWCDNSYNVQHSLKLNLSKNHANIYVYDLVTTKLKLYYSIKSFLKEIGLVYTNVIGKLRYSYHTPLLGRYVIFIQDIDHYINTIPNSRTHGKQVHVYDTVDDTYTIYSSVSLAMYITCIRLLHRKLINGDVVENGFVVSYSPINITKQQLAPYDKFRKNINVLQTRFKEK